ncbi:MAG: c-type cytochrome [Gemmatimonadaceae bacterium]
MTTSPIGSIVLLSSATALILLAGCKDEKRDFREMPPAGSAIGAIPGSELQPGPAMVAESTKSPYGNNAYALAEGKRLFNQMNCSGCHFQGGGGIGPPLMDDEWIYGSDPSQIFTTIVEGRPNGMPSFKGKLSNQQVWQLVAYVRLLSGLEGTTVSSAREDHMYVSPDLQLRSPQKPKNTNTPSK